MPRFQSGASIGHYTLVEHLGPGPLGELWQVDEGEGSPQRLLMIADEASPERPIADPKSPLLMAARLPPHDNIVRPELIRGDEVPPHIVYPDVGGMDLVSYLAHSGPLSVDQTFTLIDQLLSGVAHIHKYGMDHGDVRPLNVWIDGNGCPRLIHIGVGFHRSTSFHSLDQALSAVPWMAPELRVGLEPQTPADLFGAALVGLGAFTGSAPISRRFWRDLYMGAFKPEVALWFERMIEDEPHQRFDSADAAREALVGARAGRRPEGAAMPVETRATNVVNPDSAVGLLRARLLDKRSGDELRLSNNPTSIGRIPGNDIVIPLPMVSKRHARLVKVGDDYFLEDLNSANGTLVNEQRVTGRFPLQDGDLIRVAPTSQNPAGVREYTFFADRA